MELGEATVTVHAAQPMRRRGISESELRQILAAPECVLQELPGRIVAQGMIESYLLRVFVDVDRTPPEVVTVCRTSKVAKYRSLP